MGVRLIQAVLVLLSAASITLSAPIVTAGPSLTEESWSTTVEARGSGSWFVEHYSPYCGHCRSFAPTWKLLVDSLGDEASREHDWRFAQVDCAANGDLCAAHDVKYYPTLSLYVDGVFQEEFKGERTIEKLEGWIKERWSIKTSWDDDDAASSTDTVTAMDSSVDTSDSISSADGLASATAREHDEEKRSQARTMRRTGTVEALDKHELEKIKASQDRPSFVKFYAPWCSHCKALAPAWRELAGELQQSVDVYEVDCEGPGNRAVCQKEGVKGFPTLYFYNGATKAEYKGRRTVPALRAWVEKVLASSSVKTLSSEKDVQKAIDTHEVALFYLVDDQGPSASDQALIDTVLKEIVGSAPLYLTSRLNDYARGSFVAARGGHLTHFAPSPASDSLRTKTKALLDWIRHSKLPPLTELTAATYPSVFPETSHTNKPPLVALGIVNHDDARSLDALKFMANSSWGRRGVIWAWADRARWSKYLTSLLGDAVIADPSASGQANDGSAVVVIMDPASQTFWSQADDGRPFDLDSARLDAALISIKDGSLPGHSYRTFLNHLTAGIGRRLKSMMSSSLTFVVVLFAVAAVAIACSRGRGPSSGTRPHHPSRASSNGYAKRE